MSLLPVVWIMVTDTGFYPIQPSDRCEPADHGAPNPHVKEIRDMDDMVIWKREAVQ